MVIAMVLAEQPPAPQYPHGLSHSEWCEAYEQIHHALGMESPL